MENTTEYERLSRFIRQYDPVLMFYHESAKQLAESGNRLEHLRWHEEIEIKYILSGQAEILCGPRVFIAKPGDVVVINSCEMHGIRSHGEETPSYHILMLPPTLPFNDQISDLIAPAFDRKLTFSNLICGDSELQTLIPRLFASLNDPDGASVLESAGLLALILSCLLRRHSRPSDGQQDIQKYAERLRPAIDYIYQHYQEDVRVEDLARSCSLSVYYFCRMFRKGAGCTVSEYVSQFRLEKAATLLTTTDLPVAAVAEQTGYRDESYFSRRFRAWAGCSPGRYRDQEKKRAR